MTNFVTAKDNRPMYCLHCFEGRFMLRLLNPFRPDPDMAENEDDEEYPATYWCEIHKQYELGITFEHVTHILKDFEDCGNYTKYCKWSAEETEDDIFNVLPHTRAL